MLRIELFQHTALSRIEFLRNLEHRIEQGLNFLAIELCRKFSCLILCMASALWVPEHPGRVFSGPRVMNSSQKKTVSSLFFVLPSPCQSFCLFKNRVPTLSSRKRESFKGFSLPYLFATLRYPGRII